ncbi:MAG: hypothetical protein GX160_03435 [Clostridiales bacterium]|nr:hypothetical protein [Clostridiales bacterium]
MVKLLDMTIEKYQLPPYNKDDNTKSQTIAAFLNIAAMQQYVIIKSGRW